jgi:hypothetical protein
MFHQSNFDMKNTKPFVSSVAWILLISLGFSGPSNAEIKNGYEKDIFVYDASLENYKKLLLNDDLSRHQRRIIKSQIELLMNNISYCLLTENLLIQFQKIAPDLFNEISSIKDAKGRPVNVYIKIVPNNGTALKAWGITYVNQLTGDSDAYVSEYGTCTVSVKIWAVNKALFVLAHELGHVKYQVPHLASYMNDYKKYYYYLTSYKTFYSWGHHPRDLSGKSAHHYEKRFRKEYFYFVKTSSEKIQNPIELLAKIRKNFRTII